jgi:hypothetical protein
MLAGIVPAGFLWEQVLGWPIPVMADVNFNIGLTVAVFVLTMLSVPLGFVALRSRKQVCAVVAIALGSTMSLLIFYLKFYPVL